MIQEEKKQCQINMELLDIVWALSTILTSVNLHTCLYSWAPFKDSNSTQA